tara:strand:- start:9077 stop:11473 length:2397 start_codon:yes stop_codon:yes gene_type:complete
MTPNQQNLPSSDVNNDFNIMKSVKLYTKHWIWFVLSCAIFIGLAFLKLRYTTPEYNSQAKIMLVGDDNAATPATSLLKDLKQISEKDGKAVEDEIEILKSRSLMKSVVKKLSLNIQYYMEGRIYDTQLFPDAPIKINFFAPDSLIYKSSLGFSLYFKSDTIFDFKVGEDDIPKEMAFGKKITTPIGDIVITPSTDNISHLIDQNLFVKINPLDKVTADYKDKISIAPIQESSRVIVISLDDPVLEKSKRIINTLIDEYNRISIEAKNLKSQNTADFINERISLIASDLSAADDKIEQFKTGNKLTSITSEAELYLNSSSLTEQEISDAQTQLNLVSYMKSYMTGGSSDFELIPSNVGLSEPAINNLATKYNELLSNRNSLLKGSTKSKNPIIVNLDNQLSELKQSLSQSLDNSSKTLAVKLNDLQQQSNRLNSKIYSIPGQVRESKDMERQQGTKESLYLYLLEKREEATISLTATSANAKIIDRAYNVKGIPVSPKKKMVYLAAIVFGLLIPFSIIYVKDLLDNKIHNKEDLEKEIKNITVLGEIPKLKTKTADNLIKRNDRSILSESFRIIRTNFDYVCKGRDVNEYNNVIFVTSTINGEGKSFFSINMSLTLANTGKRILLIGADIRNPKMHPSLKEQSNKRVSSIGLTEYLVDKSIIAGEAIDTYEVNGNKIDVMLSGKIPPNPAELLMSDRMKLLFDKVSNQYDYVIVDTAPSMLVTDTLLFSQYAGHTIYMTRAGYTEKRILNFAKELHANNKLNGMMLVVNDVDQSNYGYGAKYGYYGVPDKKSWFRRNQT